MQTEMNQELQIHPKANNLNTPTHSPAELPAIFQRAREAQAQWETYSLKKRAYYLLQLRETLLNEIDSLIEVIHGETGKPRFEALSMELVPSLETLTFFAKKGPKTLRDHPLSLRWVKHRQSTLNYWPLGVVAVISPWNYPFYLPFADIAMALMAGNAVILKPSEVTPLCGLQIQRLCEKAGFPHHLVQTVVGGPELGAEVIQNKPAKIFFTGSVATGKKIMAAAAEFLIPVNLELGGKDPLLVLPDADLDLASSAALWGGFSNNGQTCASIERVFVHESQKEEFTERLLAKLKTLRSSKDGTSEDYDLGRIIFPKQKLIYQAHLKDAQEKNLEIRAGGKFSEDESHLEATVLTGSRIEEAKIFQEETFGPVLPIATYQTVTEAIEKINKSPYGLTASIFTNNLKLGEDVAKKIETGTVMINEVLYTAGLPETPWGGVKDTGFGRTHSEQGLLDFVNIRHIHRPITRSLSFKSFWWFPYTPLQFKTFRTGIELYRFHWSDKLKAIPHTLSQFIEFFKKDRRL